MKTSGAFAIILIGALFPGQPAVAQERGPGPALAITLYGGGTAFSDLQRRSVLYTQAGQDPRQFDQAVSAAPAIFGGVHLAFWPTTSWGLRLTYSATRSHFETYSLERGGAADATDPSADASRLSMRHFGADVVFRLPISIRRVRTYALLGAGRTTYITGAPESARSLRTTPRERSRLTGTIGAGAQVPLEGDRLSLEFELANYVASTPWTSAEVRDGDEETVRMTAESDVSEVSLVNHARLSVGLRYVLPLN